MYLNVLGQENVINNSNSEHKIIDSFMYHIIECAHYVTFNTSISRGVTMALQSHYSR